MAARKNKIKHDEDTRKKIQTSQLINRLQDHVLGTVDLSASQIQAAKILLDKSLPNLQATTTDANVNHSGSIAWPLPKTPLDE